MSVVNIAARPNAFCRHCKDEVVIADSLACPRCGEDVDVLSLTRELRERLTPDAEPVVPPPALLTLAGERRPSVQREIPEPVSEGAAPGGGAAGAAAGLRRPDRAARRGGAPDRRRRGLEINT